MPKPIRRLTVPQWLDTLETLKKKIFEFYRVSTLIVREKAQLEIDIGTTRAVVRLGVVYYGELRAPALVPHFDVVRGTVAGPLSELDRTISYASTLLDIINTAQVELEGIEVHLPM